MQFGSQEQNIFLCVSKKYGKKLYLHVGWLFAKVYGQKNVQLVLKRQVECQICCMFRAPNFLLFVA
jgi:hypothetical protein